MQQERRVSPGSLQTRRYRSKGWLVLGGVEVLRRLREGKSGAGESRLAFVLAEELY
jgi:hypothetical protein